MIICPILASLSEEKLSLKAHDATTIVRQKGGNPQGLVSLKYCMQCPHHKGSDEHNHTVSCDYGGAIAKLPTIQD